MHKPKIAKELPPLPPEGKIILKSLPSKIFKTADTQARQTETRTSKMTNIAQRYHDLKRKKASLQHCIKAIAGEVVKSRSVHLINFSGGGQVIALKSATALILDRYSQW